MANDSEFEFIDMQSGEVYEILDEKLEDSNYLQTKMQNDLDIDDAYDSNDVENTIYLAEELEIIEMDDVETAASSTSSVSNQLICDICDGKFATIAERNSHIEKHFETIECASCSRHFIGDCAFEFHISAGKCKKPTENLDRHRCSLCNQKVFDCVEALNNHLHSVHKCFISDDRIGCVPCNRTFGRLKYLRKHIRELHDHATPYTCTTCGKSFNRKANLIEHELIHQGKYLASCDACGKSYRTPSALKLHQRTHTGEKPYKCDLCGEKAYAYNTDLKRHKRAVHGILGTALPCTQCTKVFYEPKHLRNHVARAHKTK